MTCGEWAMRSIQAINNKGMLVCDTIAKSLLKWTLTESRLNMGTMYGLQAV